MKKSALVSLLLLTSLAIVACNKPIAEVKTAEKTVSAKVEGTCSKENPPLVKDAKFGQLLDLCGKETNYHAYEFKDQNFILFNEESTIKTISTIAPFEEKTLIAGSSLYLDQDPIYLQGNDSAIWYRYADAPGSFFSLFVFQPKTKDFAYVMQVCNGNFDCDERMELSSSKSSKTLNLINSKASPEEKKLFACSFQQDKILGDKEHDIELLTSYVSNIPNRIDCYDNKYPTANKIGYIDLVTLKFVGN
ncbi:MAG: hypothetical protein NTZ25_01590 [Candidatus Peregrinibacteria bacterium]|nr:hypothetical protein [Candidatus Peregrinibacteria bacterium]